MADGFTQICRTAQELTQVQISSNGAAAVSSFNSCSLHTDLNYPNPPTLSLHRQERSWMDHMNLQALSLPHCGQKICWNYVLIRPLTKLR